MDNSLHSVWDSFNKKVDDLYRLACGTPAHLLQAIEAEVHTANRGQANIGQCKRATCAYLCTSASHPDLATVPKSIPCLRGAQDHNAEKCRRGKSKRNEGKSQSCHSLVYSRVMLFGASRSLFYRNRSRRVSRSKQFCLYFPQEHLVDAGGIQNVCPS